MLRTMRARPVLCGSFEDFREALRSIAKKKYPGVQAWPRRAR
jgi:hypothetical protein